MSRKARPAPPGISRADDLKSIIRVDHAGEFGAVRIYAGQLDVLKRQRATRASVKAVTEMAEAEAVHLRRFEELLGEHNVRPTVLQPVWRIAGYALGASSALLGERAAMACTAAVETVIDEHYAGQIARLEAGELRATIGRFRDEELEHRDQAIAHGAARAPFYRLLTSAIEAACRAAIALSERI